MCTRIDQLSICILNWSILYLAMLYRSVMRDTIARGSSSSSAAIRPDVQVQVVPVRSSMASGKPSSVGYGSHELVVGGRWLWYVDMTDWSGGRLLGNTEGAPGIEIQ